LDPALLRPGRFDRRVVVSLPDVRGREGILKVHTNRIPLASDVDLSILARGTPGFSGADLANLVNEAALNAARYGRKAVGMRDFEDSKDKVLMGAERRSMIMSESEKKTTAFHEAGHALVAALLPDADPIHKVTIIPRGMALGVTQLLPESERYSASQVYVEAMIAVKMGGRIAEELILNQITSGAHDDLEKATSLARKMVCEWGMSERLGPMTFGRKEEQPFLGRDIVHQPDYSEDTAIKIDEEVKRIVERNYRRAKDLLTTNRVLLERVATTLLEREVLDAEEVRMVIEGIPLKEREPAPSETTPEKKVESKDEKKKASLTPPILPEPKSIPQS
jgi:cell division protease FtsH